MNRNFLYIRGYQAIFSARRSLRARKDEQVTFVMTGKRKMITAVMAEKYGIIAVAGSVTAVAMAESVMAVAMEG